MTGRTVRILTVAPSFVAGLLLLPSAAIADVPITMKYLNVYNTGAQMGGVYDSPYWLDIGGVKTLAICDDYTNEIAGSWTAYKYTLGQVANAKFTSADVTDPKTGAVSTVSIQTKYNAAAWLAVDLIALIQTSPPDTTLVGEYSYAIWQMFDPDAYKGWGGGNFIGTSAVSEVDHLMETALAKGVLVGPSNVYIYTPEPNKSSQEFLVVTSSVTTLATPEASSVATLAANLFALLGAVILVRRRILRNAGASH